VIYVDARLDFCCSTWLPGLLLHATYPVADSCNKSRNRNLRPNRTLLRSSAACLGVIDQGLLLYLLELDDINDVIVKFSLGEVLMRVICERFI